MAVAMEKVYTVNEAAALTTLSPWTIWAKLSKGEIRRTKVAGRRTVIKESELAKLFKDEER
jgi:excisionase family DNA binding protein